MTTPTYTPQTWANGSTGGTPINATRLSHMETGIQNAEETLLPTAVKTSAYTAQNLDLVLCDTRTAAFTLTLPTAPANGTTIAAKLLYQSGSNAVTIQTGGTDVINIPTGGSSTTLAVVNQYKLLEYFSGVWYVETESLPLATLDTRYLNQGGIVAASLKTASYTLVLADVGTVIEMNTASASGITVPPSSSVSWPTGALIGAYQVGAGQLSIVAGSGVTLQTPASLTARAQFSYLSLRYRGSNIWAVSGDLT